MKSQTGKHPLTRHITALLGSLLLCLSPLGVSAAPLPPGALPPIISLLLDEEPPSPWKVTKLKSFNIPPQEFVSFDNELYFLFDSSLWKTDNTPAGTTLVRSLTNAAGLTLLGDQLCYTGSDGAHQYLACGSIDANGDYAPHVVPRPALVTDVAAGYAGLRGDAKSFPTLYDLSGGWQLYLPMFYSATIQHVGISDGSTMNNYALSLELADNYISAVVASTSLFSSSVFVAGFASGIGRELWEIVAGGSGANLVANINPGSGSSDPRELIHLKIGSGVSTQHRILFSADNPTYGRELWVYDTNSNGNGANLVKDIKPGSAGSDPKGLIAFQQKVFFWTKDSFGSHLWKTDGDNAGTSSIHLFPGAFPERPFTERGKVFGGSLYFPTSYRNVYRTQGTDASTVKIFNGLVQSADVLEVPMLATAYNRLVIAKWGNSSGVRKTTLSVLKAGGGAPAKVADIVGKLEKMVVVNDTLYVVVSRTISSATKYYLYLIEPAA